MCENSGAGVGLSCGINGIVSKGMTVILVSVNPSNQYIPRIWILCVCMRKSGSLWILNPELLCLVPFAWGCVIVKAFHPKGGVHHLEEWMPPQQNSISMVF